METLTKIFAAVVLTILWQIWFTVIDSNLAIKAKRKIQLEFNNNIHTAVHGVVCSWMGLTAILVCNNKELKYSIINAATKIATLLTIFFSSPSPTLLFTPYTTSGTPFFRPTSSSFITYSQPYLWASSCSTRKRAGTLG